MSRIKRAFTKNTDGTENLELTCKICGKPISKSNKYGMYCEDKCGIEEDKAAFLKLNNLINSLFK